MTSCDQGDPAVGSYRGPVVFGCFHFFFSLFLWLRPASRFDRHFQTHRTRLGRPFIAHQLSTRGPHIVISYVWAGVATTDQIRSERTSSACQHVHYMTCSSQGSAVLLHVGKRLGGSHRPHYPNNKVSLLRV